MATSLSNAGSGWANVGKKIGSSAALGGLCFAIGGVLGLITFVLLIWASTAPIIRDSENKHGIGSSEPSRLGGLVILFSLSLYLSISPLLSETLAIGLQQDSLLSGQSYVFLALLIGLVGFADDLREGISPGFRLLLLLAICFFGFYLNPDWMPERIFPIALGFSPDLWIMVLLSSLVLIGFTNAGNMVDGANGLLGSITVGFFVIAYAITANYFYLAITLAVMAFVVINITSSRIILGDLGAFGCSSMVALTSFQLYQDELVSLWVLACLLAYPCLEILRVVLVRALNGTSPFSAGNDHLHNFLHAALLDKGIDTRLANTLTGLTFGASFPLLVWGIFFSYPDGELADSTWFTLFLVEALVFLALFARLKPKKVKAS
ncbi:MAG: MraY family glycosyltransferase [Betaproteobacteria bacterium]|jgi:UDP-GlcNAc:undecaprenyl-phosphate GlcNAc-1-phosphate transferase